MKTPAVVLLLSMFGAATSGCSLVTSKEHGITLSNGLDFSLIAENLVDVLGSLESINRVHTTFQMINPSTPIGNAVFQAIENQGYGIQLVTGDLGENFLRYKAELSQTESGVLEVYSISVANTDIERRYAVIDGKTTPTSPVTIRTDQVIESDLDDSLFDVLLERSVSSVIEINTGVPEVVLFSDNTLSDAQIEVVKLTNYQELGQSNYQSTFDEYTDLTKHNLEFPNDSLVLGSANKILITDLAAQVNPATDILSIIGCSHGQTQFSNGNQLLAEGRAQRVTESLMFAGLDPELIFDEACWDAEYWDEFAPRRGVIVTHKRLKGNG